MMVRLKSSSFFVVCAALVSGLLAGMVYAQDKPSRVRGESSLSMGR